MSEKEARKAEEQARPEAELNDEELEQAAGGLSIISTGPVNSFTTGCGPVKTIPVTSFDCPILTVADPLDK